MADPADLYGSISLGGEKYLTLRKEIDNSGWDRNHSLLLATMMSSFFVWGMLLVIGPLITNWPVIPSSYFTVLLVSSPAGLLSGNLLMGYLSDRYGRRRIFILTLLLGIMGIFGILISLSPLEIVVAIFLAEMGFGGDETVSLAFMAEQFPIRYRGKALIAASNSANIGVAAISAVFLFIPASILDQKAIFAAMIVVALAVALLTRSRLPESLRWDFVSRAGSGTKRTRLTRYDYFKFLVLLSFAITIVLTFALVGYVIGPYEFPQLTSMIAFAYGAAEAIAGVALLFLINMIGRRKLSVIAYVGGFMSMALFIPYAIYSRSIVILAFLLALNAIFGEMGWAVRELLQPELFTTANRGKGIAGVRGIAYVFYIITLFAITGFSLTDYIIYAVIIWAIGMVASVVWYMRGRETMDASLI